MSQLRQCPITQRWVVVASERAARPNEYRTVPQRKLDRDCPFCRGHEGETPDALFAVTRDFAPATNGDWQVRVVPNKYPALHAAAAQQISPPLVGGAGGGVEAAYASVSSSPHEIFVSLPAAGSQEVVIESPRHVSGLGELTPDEAALVMRVYRERLRAHREAGQHPLGLVFKNVGPAAGASIEHSHSQIAILPAIPEAMQQVLARGREAANGGKHLWLDMLQAELTAGERIVAETERLVAFCPYAPRFPYETWIFPREPEASFEETSDATATELGHLTRDLIRRLEKLLDKPAYNYMLFTAPWSPFAPPLLPFASRKSASLSGGDAAETHFRGAKGHNDYLWHLELFPRTATPAGFEWGLGWHINPVSPETAAAELREAM